jgi:hypothetical protein
MKIQVSFLEHMILMAPLLTGVMIITFLICLRYEDHCGMMCKYFKHDIFVKDIGVLLD